jgi:hypothetical protein
METVVDVSALEADLTAVDALARLRLLGPLRLRGVSAELRSLIGFCGLADALGVEAQREPEEREEAGRVEEERQLPDPPIP